MDTSEWQQWLDSLPKDARIYALGPDYNSPNVKLTLFAINRDGKVVGTFIDYIDGHITCVIH